MSVRGVTSVPWNVAMGWGSARRTAALIVAGEAEGGHWDWQAWRWHRPNPGQP